MMNWTSLIFIVCGVTGLCVLLAGIFMFRNPPRNINGLYGYRTKRSMRSQEAWDFAQRYGSLEIIKAGLYMIFAGIAGVFFQLGQAVEMVIAMIAILAFCALPIINTEQALKKRF